MKRGWLYLSVSLKENVLHLYLRESHRKRELRIKLRNTKKQDTERDKQIKNERKRNKSHKQREVDKRVKKGRHRNMKTKRER